MSGYEIPAILAIVSAVGSYAISRSNSNAERAAAMYQARENERMAQQERAAAHLEAARKRRENQFKLGQQKDALGGSGFTLDDPTAVKIIGDSAAAATLAEQLIIAQGDQRARNMEAQARMTKWSGKVGARQSTLAANVQLVSDTGSWFTNYGKNLTTSPKG